MVIGTNFVLMTTLMKGGVILRIKKTISSILIFALLISVFCVLNISANAATSPLPLTNSSNYWTSGYYNADSGEGVSATNYIRTSNFINVSSYDWIKVDTDGSYGYNVHFYDSNHTYISSLASNSAYLTTAKQIVPKGNYVKFSINKSGITTANYNDISIVGSGVPKTVIGNGTKNTGSLYVYKYEMENSSEATHKGSGETSDSSHVDELITDGKASPLADVVFKATLIESITNTDTSINTIDVPSVEEAKESTAINTYYQKTDSNGYAAFNNLPLGIYLVQEESSPNQTTKKAEDFVVSIPSTNANSDDWNYNVFAYPKNQTKYTNKPRFMKLDYSTGLPLTTAKFYLYYMPYKPTINSSGTNYSVSQGWVRYKVNDQDVVIDVDENGYLNMPENLPVNTKYRLYESTVPDKYITPSTTDRYIPFFLNEDEEICSIDGEHDLLDEDNPNLLIIYNTKPSIHKYIDASEGDNTSFVEESYLTHTSDTDYDYYTFELESPNAERGTLSQFGFTDNILHTRTNDPPTVLSVKDINGNVIPDSEYTFKTTYKNWGYSLYTCEFNLDPSSSYYSPNTKYYVTIRTFLAPSTTVSTVRNTATLKYSKSNSVLNSYNTYNTGQFRFTDGTINASTGAEETSSTIKRSTMCNVSSFDSIAINLNSSDYKVKIFWYNSSQNIISSNTSGELTQDSYINRPSDAVYFRAIVWKSNGEAVDTVLSGDDSPIIINGQNTASISSNEVIHYRRGYCFKKTDGNGDALTGAEFKLYRSYADAVDNNNPVVAFNAASSSYTDTFTTNANGIVTVNYLGFEKLDIHFEPDAEISLSDTDWSVGNISPLTGLEETVETNNCYKTNYCQINDFNHIQVNATGQNLTYNIFLYDEEKNFLSSISSEETPSLYASKSYTTEDAYYCRMVVASSSVFQPSSIAQSLEFKKINRNSLYLMETKAPQGYSLLSEPQEIIISDESNNTPKISVINFPIDGFPFTGGTIYFFIIGVVILSLSLSSFIYYKRKSLKNKVR